MTGKLTVGTTDSSGYYSYDMEENPTLLLTFWHFIAKVRSLLKRE